MVEFKREREKRVIVQIDKIWKFKASIHSFIMPKKFNIEFFNIVLDLTSNYLKGELLSR